MDLRTFAIVFGTVFLAELGDKTQLTALLFAGSGKAAPLTVFIAASLALIASTGLAVLLGTVAGKALDPRLLSYVAGAGFVIIGIWTIVTA